MFSVSEDVIREEYDDLSDLDNEQMERVREWEQQLSGKWWHQQYGISDHWQIGNSLEHRNKGL